MQVMQVNYITACSSESKRPSFCKIIIIQIMEMIMFAYSKSLVIVHHHPDTFRNEFSNCVCITYIYCFNSHLNGTKDHRDFTNHVYYCMYFYRFVNFGA